MTNPKLILASKSKIRADILSNAGIKFSTQTSYVDEDKIKQNMQSKPAEEISLALAKAKAQKIKANKNDYIIGADQILSFQGQIFDKPKSIKEARARLIKLRAKQHCLIGAISLVQNSTQIWSHLSKTKLTMRNFSDQFLDEYLIAEQEHVLHSVGAYRFEAVGAQLFENVQGDFFSILGLSLLPLMAKLREVGVLKK